MPDPKFDMIAGVPPLAAAAAAKASAAAPAAVVGGGGGGGGGGKWDSKGKSAAVAATAAAKERVAMEIDAAAHAAAPESLQPPVPPAHWNSGTDDESAYDLVVSDGTFKVRIAAGVALPSDDRLIGCTRARVCADERCAVSIAELDGAMRSAARILYHRSGRLGAAL